MTNATNNRVITSSGGSDANAESNLTFDGTTLSVSGVAQIDNIKIDGNTISSTNGTNSSITLLPKGNGDVVIGDGTDNELHCKGDVIAFHTSDINLKENITPISNALNKVSSLTGNTFTWIEGSKHGGENDTGVIAQEVEALGLPGITTTRDDGTKAVRYDRLIPVLIEAVKELTAKVNALENK